MGGCQNYGPRLGTLNTRCRIIIGMQKGTIILTTTPIITFDPTWPKIPTAQPLQDQPRVLSLQATLICRLRHSHSSCLGPWGIVQRNSQTRYESAGGRFQNVVCLGTVGIYCAPTCNPTYNYRGYAFHDHLARRGYIRSYT